MAQKRGGKAGLRASTQAVSQPEQIAALASAVRQDIVDTLTALGGEGDVATVAAELGRPADGLYYHFELLANAGLLQRIGSDSGARRYRVGRGTGRRLQLDYRAEADGSDGIAKVVDALLASARRDFRAALGRGGHAVRGRRRELWAGRVKGWVDDRGLERLNELLEEMQQLLHGPREEGCDRLVSLSFVLAPATARPTRRGKG